MNQDNRALAEHSARVYASMSADGLGVVGRALRGLRGLAATTQDEELARECIAIGELVDDASTRVARLRERLADG